MAGLVGWLALASPHLVHHLGQSGPEASCPVLDAIDRGDSVVVEAPVVPAPTAFLPLRPAAPAPPVVVRAPARAGRGPPSA